MKKGGLYPMGLVVCGMLCAALLGFAQSMEAAVKFEPVEYKAGETTCQGLLVYDDKVQGARPGVLIAHQWKGLTDYEKKRAEMLAQMGYVAFCADVYGKGVRPESRTEAAKEAGKYKSDRALLRMRINAALKTFRQQQHVAPQRIAAIGYCFGGTTILELARSGADVAGVVSFHGGLGSPTPADAKNIKCKVLALHGADDPGVPADEVQAFEKEMREARVDWQLVKYGGAVHSFTDWNAGDDNSKGAAYNKRADERSWREMEAFLREALP